MLKILKILYFSGDQQFFQKSPGYIFFMIGVENFSFIGRGGTIWDRGDSSSKIINRGGHQGASIRDTLTGYSRASLSALNKRVSYAITTFSGPQPIKLLTAENKKKELTNKLLGTHEFPLYIRAIDDTYIKIAELNEHYSDYINRKGYFSLKVQAVCD